MQCHVHYIYTCITGQIRLRIPAGPVRSAQPTGALHFLRCMLCVSVHLSQAQYNITPHLTMQL